MSTKVPNEVESLRELLTDLYVAVLGYLPTDEFPRPLRPISSEAWDALMTTVLDAGEGRDFTPLELPWPPEHR